MAEELPEVTQKFTADTEEYEAWLEEAAMTAQEYADANKEAQAAVDDMRDATIEAAPAVGHLRDEALEAAGAMDHYQDAAGRWRDGAGRFVAAAEVEALGLGHVRDEALEAAGAMGVLKREEKGAADAGLFSGLMSFLKGLPGKIPDSIGPLPLVSLLAIIPAIEAGLVEVTGLVSGFAAAGAGAGAFAVLALPAIKQVTGALGDTKGQLAKQPELVQQAVREIKGLEAEYGKISKAFEPQVFKVFNDALKIANQLLPDVTPFASTFATAVGGLLTRLGNFTGSAGFKDFLQQFHGLEGPSITAIGNGIGQVAGAIGKLLTTMSAKDDVRAINIAFGILSGTIDVVAYMVHRLMTNWDEISGAAKRVGTDVKQAAELVGLGWDMASAAVAEGAHNIANWFDEDRHAVATLAHDFAAHFDEIRHDIAQWVGDVRHDGDEVISFFKGLPGRIVSALGNLGGLLLNAGASIIHGLITGIENAIPGLHSALSWVSSLIPSWKGPIEKDAQMLVPHGMVIMQGLMRGISSELPALQALLAGVTGVIPASIGAHGPGGVVGAAAAGGSSHMTVNVNASLAPGLQAYQTPAFQHYLQTVVQEAFARWSLQNPGTGFGVPGRTR